LEKIALDQGATMYMVFLALYNIFLSKICSQEVIVIGTTVAGRRHVDLEEIIGVFVDTLAFKSCPSGDKTFNQYLKEVKDKTITAFENRDYQFEDLVEKVVKGRASNRNPLFDVRFTMNNIGPSAREVPGLKENDDETAKRVSKFDLTLETTQSGDTVDFVFEYCIKLFKKETIKTFVGYFKEITAAVTRECDIKLADIKISHGFLSVDSNIDQIDLDF
jgi:non-ribosomal peptide synthetase component F